MSLFPWLCRNASHMVLSSPVHEVELCGLRPHPRNFVVPDTVLRAASVWGYIWREHRDHGFGTNKSQEASQTGRLVRRRLKLVCSLLLPLKEYISPLQLSEVFREYTCTLHTQDWLHKQNKSELHFSLGSHIFRRGVYVFLKLSVWCSPWKPKI